jgi:hypothetical protein
LDVVPYTLESYSAVWQRRRTETVTYYDREEAEEEREYSWAADLGIRNLGIITPEEQMCLKLYRPPTLNVNV